ncbi:MAG: hypothetical protein ABI837_05930 [Acidobacteriota bacterium]
MILLTARSAVPLPQVFPWLMVAVIGSFIAATVLSNAGGLSRSLRPFLKRSVRVVVWGSPPPGSDVLVFEVDSIAAFGAGLLIHLRQGAAGPRILLKVAQPRFPLITDGRAEIGVARYVSWQGAKFKPAGGQPAVVITIAS